MKNISLASLSLLLPSLALAQLPSNPPGGQVVGTGGVSVFGNPTNWSESRDVGGAGQISYSTAKPCGTVAVNTPGYLNGACSDGFNGVGYGSLRMSVTGQGTTVGNETQYPDWAFWYRYAQGDRNSTVGAGASFGNLAALTDFSFDWFRTGLTGWDDEPGTQERPIPPLDWRYKTPVVRLQLQEVRAGQADRFSELIWEGYYNQKSLGTAGGRSDNFTRVDTWVRQTNMQLDNFWYVRPAEINGTPSSYATNSKCADEFTFWQGGIDAASAAGLFAAPVGVNGVAGCLFGTTEVRVIGIAVGVGSQWPLPYEGYVDNVRLGFNNAGYRLDANFDELSTTVPEPSTWALMGAGLLAIGAAARRRNRGQTPPR